jgi:CubicO group peptidase (beta-lactamase class C family)
MRPSSVSAHLSRAVVCAALAVASHAAETVDVSQLLEPIRANRDVPALAAAAMKGGELVSVGATGLRRLGGTNKVTVDDLWHIGSCTKSMTASVAAMLVERGALRWDETVGEALAAKCPKMDSAWKSVTLDQLLRHRAGAPPEPPPELWGKAWARLGTPSSQRWAFVTGILAVPPPIPPGSRFAYSNQGYSIVGQMMEIAAKKPWEELMREMLFKPLQLRSAGFGAPGNPRKEDQPWGHRGKIPVVPGPTADNPAAIGPGGIVHLSIKDFARYAAWHARGRDLLPAEEFAKLHTALPGQDYAFGWHVAERNWGGKVLTHNGTNTMNFAVMWVAPERDFAVVAATNVAGKDAEQSCDDACALLIQRHLETR